MTDTTVLAAIIGGVVTIVVTLIGVFTKIADAAATRSLQATENTRGDVLALREEVRQLQADKRAQDLRLERVEGTARDQAELIDDMLEIIEWVERGAKPPIPDFSWRISQMMLRRQSPQSQTE